MLCFKVFLTLEIIPIGPANISCIVSNFIYSFFFSYCVSHLGNYTHWTGKYFMYCFKFYIFVLHLKQKVRKFLAVSFAETWPLKTEGSTLPKSKSNKTKDDTGQLHGPTFLIGDQSRCTI